VLWVNFATALFFFEKGCGHFVAGRELEALRRSRRAVVARRQQKEMLHCLDRYVLDATFRHIERYFVILLEEKFQKICEDCRLIDKVRIFSLTTQLSFEFISGLILPNHADICLEDMVAQVLQWAFRDPELDVRLLKMPLQQGQLPSRLHKSD
jgi:hypothetical protein